MIINHIPFFHFSTKTYFAWTWILVHIPLIGYFVIVCMILTCSQPSLMLIHLWCYEFQYSFSFWFKEKTHKSQNRDAKSLFEVLTFSRQCNKKKRILWFVRRYIFHLLDINLLRMKYACFGFQITFEFVAEGLADIKFFTTNSEFLTHLFKSLQVLLSKQALSPMQDLQYLSMRITNVNDYDEHKSKM